jgi:hypothetical protein
MFLVLIAVPSEDKFNEWHTMICFAENQLCVSQICLSLLTSTHRMILQHQPVRSFQIR